MTIDWVQYEQKTRESYETGEQESKQNWLFFQKTKMIPLPGGALLLADLIRKAVPYEVVSPQVYEIEKISSDDTLHSLSILEHFESGKSENESKVYRVKEYKGYAGPDSGKVVQKKIDGSDTDIGFVVIDDAGNGFRDSPSIWPEVLQEKKKTIPIILKMSRPPGSGLLFDTVLKDWNHNMVVIVNANDLRDCGCNISRRVSWERTSLDFMWQIFNATSPEIQALSKCRNLLVKFGIEGVIHYQNSGERQVATLYYDPNLYEDGLRDSMNGKMQGVGEAFTAGFVQELLASGSKSAGTPSKPGKVPELQDEKIPAAITRGMQVARRFFNLGFGKPPEKPQYPVEETFSTEPYDRLFIASIPLPRDESYMSPDLTEWTIFKTITRGNLEEAAFETVRKGSHPLLQQVPKGQFGKLKTLDRTEIESFQSIRNLIKEYLEKPKSKNPLSIAVFGPPGSGKSFGVTQLALSIVSDDSIEKIEFNLSQFKDTHDLVNGFHRVRDIVLKGKVPLVFFDEFDTQFEGKRLGWLKYFLAPMQDGEFQDGDLNHPIGRAIFVFAGGTSPTFSGFTREKNNDPGEIQFFRDVKGPDFVSRLRGYVNIIGPNPVNENESLYMIRRAMLLRTMLEDQAPHLFDKDKRLCIDDGVLRALITVPYYKHGVRSIAAIIDMSILADRRKYEQAAIPPAQQLDLHVDASYFYKLILRDAFYQSSIEKLAQEIHNHYLEGKKWNLGGKLRTKRPWNELTEEIKNSNRRQANQIPEKLRRLNYGIIPALSPTPLGDIFTPADIESLARIEHTMWMEEKKDTGWVYGKEYSQDTKIHPDLVDWDHLDPEEKKKDMINAKLIPTFLEKVGFEVYPLK